MFMIRNMRVEDVEAVARMVALDHDSDKEKGYVEAKQHTLDHLGIVAQHCYVVEKQDRVVAVMVLHPQEKMFEIEDFHVSQVEQNEEALRILKRKLLAYLETVETEVLCCPYALRQLITSE